MIHLKTVTEAISVKQAKNLERALDKEYNQALEDPVFTEIVSKLQMDSDVLKRYTSSLQDCVEEYKHCKNCKNLLACPNKIMGHCYLPFKSGNGLEFGYKACRKYQKKQKENHYLKNMYLYHVSDELLHASMKEIYKEDRKRFPIFKWEQEFLKKFEKDIHQKGLFLHGSFGSGKSYILAALFHELAKKNYQCAILFWPEFLNHNRGLYPSEFAEMLEKMKKVPLLLIDDIGAENTTAWSRDDVLMPLLQYRMDHKLATFFTSNLNYEELEDHFSISKNKVDIVKARRIMERIRFLTDEIELVSDNLRK